jgi:hypothetical protein
MSKYEFSINPPKPISHKEYQTVATQEFKRLLEKFPNDEKAFQQFFEKNPGFLPGARAEFDYAPSSHGPHLDALITQPKINGLVMRNPDFLWFAYDSMVLSPILIEIEAPSKKYFKKDGCPTASFNNAKNQLDEWKTILSRPENILKFLNEFNLPKDLQDLYFKAYFVLIYGRRQEFAGNPWLTQKRSHLLSQSENQILMTYDRLQLQVMDSRNFRCCEVKMGRYIAKYLSPIFRLEILDSELLQIENLDKAIDQMMSTSNERKEFLIFKLPVLLDYLNSPDDKFKIGLGFLTKNCQFDE